MPDRRLTAVLLVSIWIPGAVGAQDADRIRSAIERVTKAPAEERRAAVRELVALGTPALADVRRARDAASDAEPKAALDRAARWILAAKLQPILKERSDSNLTFDGQYADLKAEGPEAAAALLGLFDDEGSPAGLRIAAARALADVGDAGLLGDLERLEADPLLHSVFREEAGTLMAIFGRTRALDRKIQEFVKKAERKGRNAIEEYTNLKAHQELSSLYYRIRKYRKAIESYERAVEILESLRKSLPPDNANALKLDREMALTCYNAACSLSLNREFERAKEMLRRAVDLDPAHLKNLDQDGDLRNLREAPGYQEFKRELEKGLEKKSL